MHGSPVEVAAVRRHRADAGHQGVHLIRLVVADLPEFGPRPVGQVHIRPSTGSGLIQTPEVSERTSDLRDRPCACRQPPVVFGDLSNLLSRQVGHRNEVEWIRGVAVPAHYHSAGGIWSNWPDTDPQVELAVEVCEAACFDPVGKLAGADVGPVRLEGEHMDVAFNRRPGEQHDAVLRPGRADADDLRQLDQIGAHSDGQVLKGVGSRVVCVEHRRPLVAHRVPSGGAELAHPGVGFDWRERGAESLPDHRARHDALRVGDRAKPDIVSDVHHAPDITLVGLWPRLTGAWEGRRPQADLGEALVRLGLGQQFAADGSELDPDQGFG